MKTADDARKVMVEWIFKNPDMEMKEELKDAMYLLYRLRSKKKVFKGKCPECGKELEDDWVCCPWCTQEIEKEDKNV